MNTEYRTIVYCFAILDDKAINTYHYDQTSSVLTRIRSSKYTEFMYEIQF